MNDEQLLRYSRHLLLKEVDIDGQERLLAAKVAIVGMGGLGSAAAIYLAASGVGELRLIDDDQVDLSNLQRQIVHSESDLGRPKVASAADHLRALNSTTRTTTHAQRFSAESGGQLLEGVDLALDCSDNFATRFTLNRVSHAQRTPLLSAAAVGMDGQLTMFDPRDAASPCYHCLYGERATEEEQSCARSGVLAPLVGVMGTLQALEAIKWLAGVGEKLVGRLLVFDARDLEWRSLKLPKDPRCPVCGAAGK
ncbi:MAG: molybdopterin-synthase adenylyltransferase MoeB [Pseudomonadota bacterium]|nr:molybdopterin-synthase adenylyltransferase MoeB [Pseudomonadota bacterium]